MIQHRRLVFAALLAALLLIAAAAVDAPAPTWQAASVAGGWAGSLSLSSAGVEQPTAVVLSSFSARIEGPSASLWAMSATLLTAGFLLVVRHYPRKR